MNYAVRRGAEAVVETLKIIQVPGTGREDLVDAAQSLRRLPLLPLRLVFDINERGGAVIVR